MGKEPIFDDGDRHFDDITSRCNNCEEINKKLEKAKHDYEIKKQGATLVSDETMKQKMIAQFDNEFTRKIDQLTNVKKRHCKD